MLKTNQIYEYQKRGVAHLIEPHDGLPHALLGWAPGTGKTIVDIEANKAASCKTGIIVCPKSVKVQWSKQMVKWGLCAEDEIQIVTGRDAVIDKSPWKVINYDLVREKEICRQLLRRDWHSLSLDEGHRVKSHTSKQTAALLHLTEGIATKCWYKWVLSGSIVPNRPLELYTILRSLAPNTLRNASTFEEYKIRYCGGFYADGKGASNIPELTGLIQDFASFVSLADVWEEIPDLIENDVWLADVDVESHPEWLGLGFMPEPTERRIIAEAKVPHMVSYITDRIEDGSGKLVIFCYHRNVIEMLEQQLAKYRPVKIMGGMSDAKRENSLQRFEKDPAVELILIQIGAGGEAIDRLQHVSREYIEAEPEWSPGREDQASARLLRLGQKHTVIGTRLLVAGSYEEIIYRASQRKRRVINVITKTNQEIDKTMATDDTTRTAAAAERVAAALERIVPLCNHLLDALNVAGAMQAGAAPFVAPPYTPPQPAQLQQPVPTAQVQQYAPAPFAAPPLQQPAPFPGQPLPFPAQQALPAYAVQQPAPLPFPPTPQSPAPAQFAPPPGYPQMPASAPGVDPAQRAAFEQAVLQKLDSPDPSVANANFQKLADVLQQFGVSKLGDLPDANMFPTFMQMLG